MNPFLSATNQKLLFARLQVEAARSAGNTPYQTLAACQGAVLQLYLGYRFHLQEIAATYRARQPEAVDSPESLASALEAIDKWPAEASEMLALVTTAGSWLNRLRSAWDGLLLPPVKAAADGGSADSIALVNASDQAVELTPESVADWLEQLRELVERHRGVMEEY